VIAFQYFGISPRVDKIVVIVSGGPIVDENQLEIGAIVSLDLNPLEQDITSLGALVRQAPPLPNQQNSTRWAKGRLRVASPPRHP
jgi:hypothetical protein